MVNSNLLKTVRFVDTHQWNVKHFFATAISSKYSLEEIGKHTIHITEKTKLFENPEKEYAILGISNEVGMFDAYTELGKNINQPYIHVEDGCLAYNPYRVNVGSIGLKTPLLKNEYISPAYVVFKCKGTILPEYLYLVLKSRVFNTIIQEKTTGSVRQTLSYENLSTIKIPVPATIDEQRKLVGKFNSLINEANFLKQKADSSEANLEKTIFDSLGIKAKENYVSNGILNTVRFQNVHQWGYDKVAIRFPYSFEKYKAHSFVSTPGWLSDIYRGRSPQYSHKSNSVILNQKCNRKNEIDLTHAKSVNDEWLSKIPYYLLTQKNDIMINSTGEGTIGRASVIISDDQIGLAYDSHMLLLRVNLNEVDPLLWVYLFNSPLGQRQVDLYKSAQATKQTELGIENTKKIRFPLPSLSVQKRLSDMIEKETFYIKKIRQQAEELYQKAKMDFEEVIFGE